MSETTELARLLQETRDLADQDIRSGHLTQFWYQRVLLVVGELARGVVLQPSAEGTLQGVLENALARVKDNLALEEGPPPGIDGPEWSSRLNRQIEHFMNCGYESGEECSCLIRRKLEAVKAALGTERTMHAAWRKRAEEAEAALVRPVPIPPVLPREPSEAAVEAAREQLGEWDGKRVIGGLRYVRPIR